MRRGVQQQRDSLLGSALFQAGMVDWEERVRSEPGQFYGWTTTGENGLGVGVYSKIARKDHTVSLFHIKTREENEVKFSSLAHLERYPPSGVPRTALGNWIAFIESLNPMRRIISIYGQEDEYFIVPLSRVKENVEVLLERMRPLMGVDRSSHSPNP